MPLIYKIVASEAWESARKAGVFNGAAIDLADGYIHFSNASQVEETAARHFSGHSDLMLIAFDADRFGPALRWEASRGGALFPHLHGSIDPAWALWARPLPWSGARHDFPEGWRA
jgi:uncharacterized protein (DUF952 family)